MPDWLDPLLMHAEPASPASASGTSKRTLIIEAALAVLRRDGIAKLSMRRVAKEAGVALGLAHYHFTSKSALLAAVVEMGPPAAAIEITPSADGMAPAGDLSGIVRDAAAPALDDLRLRADIDSQALREPLVASAVALERRGREAVLMQRLRAARRLPPTCEAEPLVAVLMAALDSLELRAAIDPGFDLAAARRSLERLWRGACAA